MGILSKLFSIKKAKINKVLDNLSTPEEKLEWAESQLGVEKSKLLDKAQSIVRSCKKTDAALNLEKKRLNKTKELMDAKIKSGDEETAKLLFINYDSLKNSVEILEKAKETCEANKAQIKVAVGSIDSRIRKAKAEIKRIRNLRDTQEIAELAGVNGIDGIGKFIEDIESYIKDQQWDIEAKNEVSSWTKESDKLDMSEINSGLDEVDDKFESYKKSVQGKKSK